MNDVLVNGPGQIGQALARRVGMGRHVVLAVLLDHADGALTDLR